MRRNFAAADSKSARESGNVHKSRGKLEKPAGAAQSVTLAFFAAGLEAAAGAGAGAGAGGSTLDSASAQTHSQTGHWKNNQQPAATRLITL